MIAQAEISVTDTRNIAMRRHLLLATISPGGEQAPGSSVGVSEGGSGLQQPSNQHRYTNITSTISVGDKVPYNTMLLKTWNQTIKPQKNIMAFSQLILTYFSISKTAPKF